jgi:GT2 family glycosyltransferase
MHSRVLAVIVTYNNERTIGRCVSALAEQHDVRADIHVVDNASTDQTLACLRRVGHHVFVHANPINVGFGRAVNDIVAATVGTNDSYTHIVLVNPDVYLERGALAALLNATKEHPSAGALGGLSLRADGRVDPTSCLALPSLRQAFCRAFGLHAWPALRRLDPDRIDAVVHRRLDVVPALAGSVLLLPMPAWRAVRGFDPAYFLYGEDVDLCARLAVEGWSSLFVPACRYVHERGTSSADPAVHEWRMLAGRSLLYRRHLGAVRARVAIAAMVCGVGARHFAARLIRRPSRWTLSWQQRRSWRLGISPTTTIAASS